MNQMSLFRKGRKLIVYRVYGASARDGRVLDGPLGACLPERDSTGDCRRGTGGSYGGTERAYKRPSTCSRCEGFYPPPRLFGAAARVDTSSRASSPTARPSRAAHRLAGKGGPRRPRHLASALAQPAQMHRVGSALCRRTPPQFPRRYAHAASNPYPYPTTKSPTPHQIFHLPPSATENDIKARCASPFSSPHPPLFIILYQTLTSSEYITRTKLARP
jgi:hypothetical protein